jgi:hypothetical protein
MTEIKLPPEVAKIAKRPDLRVIAGAALGGLAIGLYVGIMLSGPRKWVPPDAPAPCPECEEKEKGRGVEAIIPPSAEELAELRQRLFEAEVEKADVVYGPPDAMPGSELGDAPD